jgi:hypothetical protein
MTAVAHAWWLADKPDPECGPCSLGTETLAIEETA